MNTLIASDVSHGQRYKALRIHTHPKYSKQTQDYDLGLLLTHTAMRMGGELCVCVFVCMRVYIVI